MMDEPALGPDEEARIRSQIATLREERQDLDDAVRALEALPRPDQLQIARLKKKKLILRDQVAKLTSQIRRRHRRSNRYFFSTFHFNLLRYSAQRHRKVRFT